MLVSSIVDPENAGVVNPTLDQRLAMGKTLKHSATVTAAASGSGLFVFFPGCVNGTLGVHFEMDTPGHYTNPTVITLQDLTGSFDYALKTSCLITIKASLQAVIGAVSGVATAAYREAAPSELLPLPGMTDLANLTNQPMDTTGAVPLAEGLAALYYPSPTARYQRISDTGTSLAMEPPSITDGGGDLIYNSSFDAVANLAPAVLTASASLAQVAAETSFASMLIDAWDGISFSGDIQFSPINPANPYPSDVYAVYAVLYALDQVTPLDYIVCGTFQPCPTAGTGTGPWMGLPSLSGPAPPIRVALTGSFPGYTSNVLPMPAGVLKFVLADWGNGSTTTAEPVNVYRGDISIRSINASQNAATLNPVTYMAYQGLAAGSQIIVGGVSNYLVVPNPVAARNLTLAAYSSARELSYYQYVLAHRAEIGLRSVMRMSEASEIHRLAKPLANPHSLSRTEARSFGWDDIWSGLKSAAGWVGDVVKQAAPALLATLAETATERAGVPVRRVTERSTEPSSAPARPPPPTRRPKVSNSASGKMLSSGIGADSASGAFALGRQDKRKLMKAVERAIPVDKIKRKKKKAGGDGAAPEDSWAPSNPFSKGYPHSASEPWQQSICDRAEARSLDMNDVLRVARRFQLPLQRIHAFLRDVLAPRFRHVRPLVDDPTWSYEIDAQSMSVPEGSAEEAKLVRRGGFRLSKCSSAALADAVLTWPDLTALGTRASGFMFPTVLTQDGDIIGTAPYIALRGNWSRYLRRSIQSRTEDNHTVFGARAEEGDNPIFPATGCDVTVLPIEFDGGRVTVAEGPAPIGHSCDLALAMHAMDMPPGIPDCVLTGTVKGDQVGPVLGIGSKEAMTSHAGLPLVGACPTQVDTTGKFLAYEARDLNAARAYVYPLSLLKGSVGL